MSTLPHLDKIVYRNHFNHSYLLDSVEQLIFDTNYAPTSQGTYNWTADDSDKHKSHINRTLIPSFLEGITQSVGSSRSNVDLDNEIGRIDNVGTHDLFDWDNPRQFPHVPLNCTVSVWIRPPSNVGNMRFRVKAYKPSTGYTNLGYMRSPAITLVDGIDGWYRASYTVDFNQLPNASTDDYLAVNTSIEVFAKSGEIAMGNEVTYITAFMITDLNNNYYFNSGISPDPEAKVVTLNTPLSAKNKDVALVYELASGFINDAGVVHPIKSSFNGKPAMRVLPGRQYTPSDDVVLPMPSGTVGNRPWENLNFRATRNVVKPPGNNSAAVRVGGLNFVGANNEGSKEFIITRKDAGNDIGFYGGSKESDVRFTDIGIFDNGYDGPFFNGSTKPFTYKGQLVRPQWDGTPWRSTSSITLYNGDSPKVPNLWDVVGERHFHHGVDRAVIYKYNRYSDTYGPGVIWSGLTSVSEKPLPKTGSSLYFDGVKYMDEYVEQEYSATIEAYTYPKEFGDLIGESPITEGVYRLESYNKPFGMTFRTLVGDDYGGSRSNYRLTIIWGALASQTDRVYRTLSLDSSPETFSWDLKTTPRYVEGVGYMSVMVIDSRVVNPLLMSHLERALYGTEVFPGRLPLPEEIIEFLK